MFDFAISFYENYIYFFYALAVVAVILEWPITVLAISSFLAYFCLSFYLRFCLRFITFLYLKILKKYS